MGAARSKQAEELDDIFGTGGDDPFNTDAGRDRSTSGVASPPSLMTEPGLDDLLGDMSFGAPPQQQQQQQMQQQQAAGRDFRGLGMQQQGGYGMQGSYGMQGGYGMQQQGVGMQGGYGG